MSKSAKKRVAIFHLAFVYSGGGERLVLEEAIALSKLGYEVICFAPIIDRKNCFPELMDQVKVKPFLPPLPSWFPDVELLSILLNCLLAPLLFFKFKDFDLYFGANQPGPWICYLLSKINKKPYAIYLAQPTRLVHPRLIDQQMGLKIVDGLSLLNVIRLIFNPLISQFDLKSIKSANLIFANGSYAKGLIEQVYSIKTINAPAGAHIKQFDIKKIPSRFHGKIKLNKKTIKKPYLLITNRHFAHKKFEYAIEAFLLLKKNNLSLVISGKETAYTKMLKKRYKNPNIHFVGLLNEKMLSYAYQNAVVYLYPSPEEDFGMGIIEAMAYGVPVVAWANAGPTGIIENSKDGFLAKPFSIDDFSEKISYLINNKVLYEKIARKGFDKINKHFSYQIHNQIISQNFQKLVKT